MAAHCVIDPRTYTAFPPHRIHFLQNVRGTRIAGHAKAECLRFLSNYQPGSGDVQDLLPRRQKSPQLLARDVVAMVLADPLAVDPIPLLGAQDINLGLGLVHASYPADRRYRLMADFQCRLTSAVQHLWMTDCDTHPASSGLRSLPESAIPSYFVKTAPEAGSDISWSHSRFRDCAASSSGARS